jgi:predicted nucleic acid-binding protein
MSNAGLVIVNSSPLIALEQIGHLDLLEKLFSTVLIPPAVARETAPRLTLPVWASERSLTQPIGPQILRASLGPGESEALSLALEVGARWVILDDRPARRLAEALGLPGIGTLGVLLAAKRRGQLPAVRPCLEALTSHGFRIATDLYELILSDAGEAQ